MSAKNFKAKQPSKQPAQPPGKIPASTHTLSKDTIEAIDKVLVMMRDDHSLNLRKRNMGIIFKPMNARAIGEMLYELLNKQVVAEKNPDRGNLPF